VAIQFQCECGKTHSAEESMAGQAFTCNACGREVKVPQASGAVGDLVSQMRGVQAERAAAPRDSAVQAARAIAGAGASRQRAAKPPMDAYARAAHHLGVKKALRIPALVVGILCVAAAAVGLVTGAVKLKSGSAITVRQGKFGPVFVDERGDERELVFAPDGTAWLIEKDADRLQWEGNKPCPMAGEFTLKVIQAKTDPNAQRFADDIRAGEYTGVGNLVFGGALLLVGPALLALSLWMWRDVRLVASRAEAGA